MMNLYRAFKIFILSLFSLVFLLIVFMEFAYFGKADWLERNKSSKLYAYYNSFHNVLLYDPYVEKTINQKNENLSLLTNVISDRAQSLQFFMADKIFNEQLFSFYISQKIDDIKSLADEYFSQYTDFRDMVIIDKNKNLIFKYGAENFSVQYYNTTNMIDGMFFGEFIALVLKKDDATLGYEYEIVTLFDYSEFKGQLEGMSHPAFVLLKDRLMRNQQFPKSVFRSHRDSLATVNKKRYGWRVLEVSPLYAGKTRMGYAGIMYPVRSLGSYLVFILKLGFLLLIILTLYLLDKWVVGRLTDKQIIREEQRVFKAEKESNEDVEGTTNDNLEWIENFIEETEVKKK